MYPEFIAIFILLGILVLLTAAVLVVLIVFLKKMGNSTVSGVQAKQKTVEKIRKKASAEPQDGGVVLCKSCSNQVPATSGRCPHCGTVR